MKTTNKKDPTTILISGASSGIGAELTRCYAQQGKTLGLMALAGSELDDIQQEALARGAAKALVFPVDVTDRDTVRQAVADFSRQAGSIDLWIACAGVDIDVPLEAFDAKRAELNFEINVNGLMYSTNAVLEQMMMQGHGRIVGMASLAGWHIYPTHADYSASKTAVMAYLESLRVRLHAAKKYKHIHVTTVSPGFVRTPMIADHTHPMMFVVSKEDAATTIMAGIARGKDAIDFPKPLVMGTKLLQKLPKPVWRVMAKVIHRLG